MATGPDNKPIVLTPQFGGAAGTGKEAYFILDALFSDDMNRKSFISLDNRYQTLLVRTWLPDTTPEQAAAMAREMEDIVRAKIALTSNKITNPSTGQQSDIATLLEQARAQEDALSDWERGNLRVMENHYLYLSAFKADPGLTDRYISTLTDGAATWAESLELETPAKAWEMQKPAFEAAFNVLRESMKEPARILSERLGRPVPLSEAALMQLNPGVTSADVDNCLAQMKPRFKDLIRDVAAQQDAGTAPELLPLPEIPNEVQLRIFSRIKDEMLRGAGYDPQGLDKDGVNLLFTSSPTGVCWGHSKDVVLSIEAYEDDLSKGLGNTWHETGHLLYLLAMNQLPPEARDKAVATFNGFGVHEAAAMTMEQAGLRRKAYELMHPIIEEELAKAKRDGLLPADFDPQDPALSAENLYRTVNRPKLDDMEWGTSELSLAPNMAWRINAFQKLFDNELQIDDLPEFWAKEMTEWTGTPTDPADFQIGEDHIFSGLGGYFWAYMTGTFTASALLEEVSRNHLAPDSKAGDLASYSAAYSDILQQRIFRHASKDEPNDLLKRAIGYDMADPMIVQIYFDRLSSAAQDGMPAPDEVLGARYPEKDTQIKNQPKGAGL